MPCSKFILLGLSFVKMLSGVNAFKIINIQEGETEVALTIAVRMSQCYIASKTAQSSFCGPQRSFW